MASDLHRSPTPGESGERLASRATPVPRLDDRYELTDRTGISMGAVPFATLQNLIRQGRLFRTDTVSKNGQLPQPLGELPEFAETFREVLPAEFQVEHSVIRPRPELSGTLDRTALVEVFVRLFKGRRTGRLFISGPDRAHDKVVIFRHGVPVNAMSNIADEWIGEVLIQQGLIDKPTFDRAVEVKRQQGSRIGSALLALDALSPRELHRALSRQAMERLLNAFRQREGSFRFVPDETALEEDILLFAEPRELVEAGLHAALSPTEVAEELDAYGDPVLQARQKALEEEWAAALTPQDREILALMTSPQPLGAVLPRIVRTHRLTTEEARLRLLTLLKLGAIAVGEESVAELEETLARLQGLDYFAALGVGRDFASATIPQAHRARLEALGALPQPGDSPAAARLREKIKHILDQAARTLADPDERAMYERAMAVGLDFEQPEVRQRLEYEHFLNRGRGALARQQYDEARQAFARAAERMPEEPMIYVHLGWAQFLAGPRTPESAREAIRQVERGLKLSSELDQAYLTIGKIHRLVGQKDEAEANLRRATELNPQNAEAQSELRQIFIRDITSKKKTAVKLELGSGLAAVLAVAGVTIVALIVLGAFVPGGAAEWPRVDQTMPERWVGKDAFVVPPEKRVLGNVESYFLTDDAWWWGRRIALMAVAFVGIFGIRRLKAGEFPFFGKNAGWVFAAIPYGVLVGFLSPIQLQVVGRDLSTLLGMTAFYVVAEQLFFIGFLLFALLKEWREPLYAIGLTAVLFGVYHMSYFHIFDQPLGLMISDLARIGAFGGGAYALLAWRSGGLFAPLLCHLLVVGTMITRSVLYQAG